MGSHFARSVLLLCLLAGGCVSPVDIPTDREVTPPPASIPLTLLDTQELESETHDERGDTVLWKRYTIELQNAVLDTGRGEERLRFVLRITSPQPPPPRPLWLDTLEVAVDGLRSGMQLENAALRALRVVFWEREEQALLRRIWVWQRGQPFPSTVQAQLALVRRSAGNAPRWLLNGRFSLASKERLLRLRVAVLLSPP